MKDTKDKEWDMVFWEDCFRLSEEQCKNLKNFWDMFEEKKSQLGVEQEEEEEMRSEE